jgi:hypothetical protein
VIVRVTGTLCGLFAAPVEVMLTLPVYVPAAMLPGVTDTLMLPGVLPPPVADSQLPPDAETE